MLRFAAVAAASAVAAVLVAKVIDHMLPAPPPAATAAVALAPPPSTPAAITKANDGNYWAIADVNDGHEVHFLIDTGASAVALTTDDAKRLGIDPASLNYQFTVATAHGTARAAQVRLASIAVAGARVENVDAYVLDSGLDTSLLGMTYLGRLSEFQATPTSLILRP